MTDSRNSQQGPDEAPPIFGSWRRWYLIVLVELAVVMLAAYAVTEVYR